MCPAMFLFVVLLCHFYLPKASNYWQMKTLVQSKVFDEEDHNNSHGVLLTGKVKPLPYLGVPDPLSSTGQVPVTVGAADVSHTAVGGRVAGGACGSGGAAGTADHASVAAAGPTHPAVASTAMATPLPAVPGAAGAQSWTVLPDVVSHLFDRNV